MHDIDTFYQSITPDMYQDESSPKSHGKFYRYVNLHPEAESIFLGTNRGSIMLEPKVDLPPDFDPRKRGWYQETMEKKGELVKNCMSASFTDISNKLWFKIVELCCKIVFNIYMNGTHPPIMANLLKSKDAKLWV